MLIAAPRVIPSTARCRVWKTLRWTMSSLIPAVISLRGKHGANFGNELPDGLTLNQQFMQRGEERYNIYCTPCHSRVGDGNGMIVQRGFKHPPTFHQITTTQCAAGTFL